MRDDHLPTALQNLALPVIASPMFTVSYPELVLAQCKAGIVGSFPALNARPAELLDQWLTDMKAELAQFKADHPDKPVGPIAVNQIVHDSNVRLMQDVQTCVKHQIPIIITSLRAPVPEIIDAVHGYGGIVLHDVINMRHAAKALDAGVDGLIVVAAGAGGHAGAQSPFALVGELRRHYQGPIILSGAITTGAAILAAQAMGADLAYIGTRFIASTQAHAVQDYKEAIVRAQASDIIYTDLFTGVRGNYIRESIEKAGLDPDNLPTASQGMSFASGSSKPKSWKDIWGAGQGVGQINEIASVEQIVKNLTLEYEAAKARLA
jgi:nitronate monooxygenase